MSEAIQSISQALRQHAGSDTHWNKAALMFAKPSKSGYQSLNFCQLDAVTSSLAIYYQKEFERRENAGSKNKNVGMYANSSPEYLLSLWALMKAGFVPLCLSPRNSKAALGDLAAKASVNLIIRGQDEHLVANTNALLKERAVSTVVDLITPELLQQMVDKARAGELENSIESNKPDQSVDPEQVVLMLHSSGSTGTFPKLVQLPQRYLAAQLSNNWSGHRLDDVIYAVPPVYHAYGVMVACNCLALGTTLVMPAVPSWPPTTKMLVDNIVESKCNVLCLLPWLLENMTFEAQEGGDERIFKLLASMREVSYASASLNKNAGDVLFKRGVSLRDGYGSSEAGNVATNQYNRTKEPCVSWNHIQMLPNVLHRLQPYGDEPNLFRIIILKDNPTLAVGQRNTPSGDYDMNDVFERVPCKSDGRQCFVIRGRVDEVIVHSTGEKTSPMPIEAAIRANCAAVQVAVVVGQQRFNTALLVQLKPSVKHSQPIIEDVWKAVQLANRDAPQHSRVVKEMIYILKEDEAIPLTDKGSIRRKLTEEKFKAQIDELYAGFTGAAGATTTETTLTNVSQAADWLEKKLSEQLAVQYSDTNTGGDRLKRDASLFSQGFDSLLATQFYYQHLRPAFPDLKLPVNILYQCPEINGLAVRLMQLLKGEDDSPSDIGAQHNIREAEELYGKYIGLMEEEESEMRKALDGTKPQVYERPSSESVVLTGCTGGLGVFLLRELLHNDRVQRVYALIRAGGRDTVKDKLEKALRTKLLDPSLAGHEKLAIWGCQLDQTQLGLSGEQWNELTLHATSVIHNAWLLNFESTTKGFDSSCIRPSYELMRLCRSRSLKQFMFVSSISAAMGGSFEGGVVKEVLFNDQRVASGIGYGQSKLLTERLAAQYATRFNVPVTIARVGQIAGDTVNGTWNTSEHVSLMIKAIETLQVMPDHYLRVDFLPVDVVAATMTALLTQVHQPDATHNSGSVNTRVAHLVNPRELRWLDLLRILQSPEVGFDFRIVRADEWLRLLDESLPDPIANPIKKLQGYFTSIYASDKKAEEKGEESSDLKFATEHTLELVPTMRYDLNPNFWSRVIAYWRSIGFLRDSRA